MTTAYLVPHLNSVRSQQQIPTLYEDGFSKTIHRIASTSSDDVSSIEYIQPHGQSILHADDNHSLLKSGLNTLRARTANMLQQPDAQSTISSEDLINIKQDAKVVQHFKSSHQLSFYKASDKNKVNEKLKSQSKVKAAKSQRRKKQSQKA